MLRTELPLFLSPKNYELTYDNSKDFNLDAKHIFKLVYSGQKIIQVSNSDWRDFIEFFDVFIDGIESDSVNILEFPDLETAFDNLKNRIYQKI